MLKSKDYDFVCTKPDELKEPASHKLRPELRDALGAPVSVMFPAFSQAFPLTTQALEKHWPTPVAAFRKHMNNWQSFLLSERADLNLFFNLTFVFEPLEGALFDQGRTMLPPKWKELYRWFESFSITQGSVMPMGWLNTPFSYSGRLNLEEYRKIIGATKAQARDFRKIIDSTNLVCWLLTDAGDALFLDEARCDHKVYHVRGTELKDVTVLDDPESLLDRYLAHYLSGYLPAEFDFRAQ